MLDARYSGVVASKGTIMKIYNVSHLTRGGIKCITLVLCAIFSVQAFAGISGSAHDFDSVAWNDTGEMCVTCHTPHNGATAADGPLWNRTASTASYTVYADPNGTINGTISAPSGASKLCLSCHDGTVALESFGGNGAVTTTLIGAVNPLVNVGSNLSDDHPISVTYTDPALAATTTSVTIGSAGTAELTGTIAELLVPSGSVECSSCHDVHNTYTVATTPLLKMTNAGSALCQTCHAK